MITLHLDAFSDNEHGNQFDDTAGNRVDTPSTKTLGLDGLAVVVVAVTVQLRHIAAGVKIGISFTHLGLQPECRQAGGMLSSVIVR